MSCRSQVQRDSQRWATFRFNRDVADDPEPYRSLVLERQRIEADGKRIAEAFLSGGRKRRRSVDHAAKEYSLRQEYFGWPPRLNKRGAILAAKVVALCSEAEFCRNFRMSDFMFDRIHDAITDPEHGCSIFMGRADAVGRVGASSLQRMYSVLQQLANGVCSFAVKDFSGVGQQLGRECLYSFCRFIIRRFGREYVGRWNKEEMEKEMAANAERGFPGMIGSIDCCHWVWDRCPIAWQGQYQDRNHKRSIVVEAIAGNDMYIHQAFVGLPGSLNDINILGRTDMAHKYMMSTAFDHPVVLNGETFAGNNIYHTQWQHCYEISELLTFFFRYRCLHVVGDSAT